MISPISAVAVTVMAPPPRPCNARAPTSIAIDCEIPHSADPMTKNVTAAWNTRLRPNRSPSLPASAVMMVEASR